MIYFKLFPNFILKKIKKLKNIKGLNIIYYFFYSLPCLLSNMFKEVNNTSSNTLKIFSILILGILILLLLPCLMRHLYLRTPWGTNSTMKSTYQQKINNLQESIKKIEENIKLKKILTPDVTWTESWIKPSNSSEREKKIMRKELFKLGYKNQKENYKIIKTLYNLAQYFVWIN